MPPAARLRAFRICREARAFAEDRIETDEPPTMVDICRAVGVSERTLQYAFGAYAGMSPMAYLRLLRLNRVRTMLLRSTHRETTVTAAAMRFGFFSISAVFFP
ncbi:helix-turn-helix domain-containing protein [Roseibium salinum]|nr:helix-turn-helix domain-containing protein [Roseibium salinum]